MNPKIVADAPEKLNLTPGDYLFWTLHAYSGYSCSKRAQLQAKQNFLQGLKKLKR